MLSSQISKRPQSARLQERIPTDYRALHTGRAPVRRTAPAIPAIPSFNITPPTPDNDFHVLQSDSELESMFGGARPRTRPAERQVRTGSLDRHNLTGSMNRGPGLGEVNTSGPAVPGSHLQSAGYSQGGSGGSTPAGPAVDSVSASSKSKGTGGSILRKMTDKLRGSGKKSSEKKSKKSLTFAPSHDSIAVNLLDSAVPHVPQGDPLIIDAPESSGFSSGAESDSELLELRQVAAQVQAEEADARKAERQRKDRKRKKAEEKARLRAFIAFKTRDKTLDQGSAATNWLDDASDVSDDDIAEYLDNHTKFSNDHNCNYSHLQDTTSRRAASAQPPTLATTSGRRIDVRSNGVSVRTHGSVPSERVRIQDTGRQYGCRGEAAGGLPSKNLPSSTLYRGENASSIPKKSGIVAKASDRVCNPQDWPHMFLENDSFARGLDFDSLNFEQFLAGELEIIIRCEWEDERDGRMMFLRQLAYLKDVTSWEEVKFTYTCVLGRIEKGRLDWDFPFADFERAMNWAKMLRPRPGSGSSGKNSEKSGKGGRKGALLLWCFDFNSEAGCSKSAPHNSEIKGNTVSVEHMCSRCYDADKSRKAHAAASAECPRK